MKVAVQCESPLLQRSLELFLGKNLSSVKQCDLILRDKKIMDSNQSLYISSTDDADIKKPFSRSQLYLKLENFYNKMEDMQNIKNEAENLDKLDKSSNKDFKLLEQKIDKLTLDYKNSVLKAVKEFYE